MISINFFYSFFSMYMNISSKKNLHTQLQYNAYFQYSAKNELNKLNGVFLSFFDKMK